MGQDIPVRGEDAVSDIVGSFLLVGITVITATALGFLLLSFDGPRDRFDVDVESSVSSGAGGWGTGDETVTVRHVGGESMPRAQVEIHVVVDGVVTRVAGDALLEGTSAFADGSFGFGDTWSRTMRVDAASTVFVRLIATGDGSEIVSESRLTATTVAPCAGDVSPPAVSQWTVTPSDVSVGTVGPVTVKVLVLDNCAGVDATTPPRLFSRLDDGTNPAFVDRGAMAVVGSNQWQGTIPDPGWSGLSGQVLQFYVSPLRDLVGNTGQSITLSDPIQASCGADVAAPTVQAWVQQPGDVTTLTSGSVTVTATLTDDCAGLDPAAVPELWHRIQDGSNPAFTQAPTMTSLGGNQWRGTIPSQSWSSNAGRTLQYELRNLKDLVGNTGTSALQSDPIQSVASIVYVDGHTAASGTVTDFANAQSASDGGLEATIAEGATVGSVTTTAYNANTVVSSTNWNTPTSGFASDNAYATTATGGSVLRYGLADPTAGGTISQVVLKAETSISSHNNDAFTLQGCLSTCTANLNVAGTASDAIASYDITNLRPGGGAWSWNDLAALEARIVPVAQGAADGTWRVDRVWFEVTYSTTTYSTSVTLTWTGVPTGGTSTLELRHRVGGDTFVVQVWDGSTWNTRAPTLASTSLSVYSYQLSTAELNGGAPRVRLVDANPTGTTQGLLFLDYARVSTV